MFELDFKGIGLQFEKEPTRPNPQSEVNLLDASVGFIESPPPRSSFSGVLDINTILLSMHRI